VWYLYLASSTVPLIVHLSEEGKVTGGHKKPWLFTKTRTHSSSCRGLIGSPGRALAISGGMEVAVLCWPSVTAVVTDQPETHACLLADTAVNGESTGGDDDDDDDDDGEEKDEGEDHDGPSRYTRDDRRSLGRGRWYIDEARCLAGW
jgi:hypothetical protein